ncbi:MAG: transcriptional regulator [Candidatus Bathyarchaeia archaeon]|nr:transcriptional regulator [Candidatus Bathyarchaeota archaeon]
MRDVVWGILLMALSITAMVIYFWALFLSPSNVKFLDRSISEWAIIIPVLAFVYLFLFVIAWIGWALATTPPSLPISEEKIKGGGEGQ